MYIDCTYVIVLIVFIKSTVSWHTKYIMFCWIRHKMNIMDTFWHEFVHHITFNLWNNEWCLARYQSMNVQYFIWFAVTRIPSYRIQYSTTSTELYPTSHKKTSLRSQTFPVEWFSHGQPLSIWGTILRSFFSCEDFSVTKRLDTVARIMMTHRFHQISRSQINFFSCGVLASSKKSTMLL